MIKMGLFSLISCLPASLFKGKRADLDVCMYEGLCRL